MPTVDIKTTYGAVGDGQIVTAVFTISSGSPNLACTTGIWSSADVGKRFAMTRAGAGGVALTGTISSFTNSTHIVLSVNAGAALSGTTCIFEWGTDDRSAFQTFHDVNQGSTPVTLTMPAGRYIIFAPGSAGVFFGIDTLTVTGVGGDAVLSDLLAQGSGTNFGGVSGHLDHAAPSGNGARLNSVSAGASTLVLKTSAEAANFTTGTWAMIGGLDIQSDGSPISFQWFEYVFITGKSGANITIQTPLANSYLDTWPIKDPTGPYGGPVSLYPIKPGWNCVHHYINIGNEMMNGGANSNGRDITFTGGYSLQDSPDGLILGAGIFASACQYWTLNDYDGTRMSVEMDKLVEKVTINGGVFHNIFCQSSSIGMLEVNNATASINGVPRNARFTNCVIGDDAFLFGPTSYGQGESVYAEDCVFGGPFHNNTAVYGPGNASVDGASEQYVKSGGILSRLKSAGTGTAPQFGVPLTAAGSGYCYWRGRYRSQKVIKLLTAYEDATHYYFQTDEPGGFPTDTPRDSGGLLGIGAVPCPHLTFINCTGNEAAVAFSNAPAGTPLGNYWKYTYTGNIASSHDVIPMIGRLTSCVIDVTTAYTGAGPCTLTLFGNAIQIPGPTVVNIASMCSIDLKATGTRTFTAGSGWTGSHGADSLSDPGPVWLVESEQQPQATSVAGNFPTVTITIQSDSGIAPLDGGPPPPPPSNLKYIVFNT